MMGFLLPILLNTETKRPSNALPSWEDKGCDTSYRANAINVYDMVIPFRLTDSLKKKPINRVYVFIKNGKQNEWACVTANPNERPWQITKMPEQHQLFENWAMKTLNWQETEYLWALADSPVYLYDRWEKLLGPTRQEFIIKRDDLASSFPEMYPGFSMKVYADLRKANTQSGLLKAGKSAAPLSHHQFGLASDVNIFKNGKRAQSYETYKKLDDSNTGLTWGGNFKGFIDPNHIQYFLNSATMLETFPELRFEFEPYRQYYLNRVHKFVEAGKADKAQDTQDLLTRLNELRANEPCVCQNESHKKLINSGLIKQIESLGYQPTNDLLIIGNLDNQTLTLQWPNQESITQRIGRWRR